MAYVIGDWGTMDAEDTNEAIRKEWIEYYLDRLDEVEDPEIIEYIEDQIEKVDRMDGEFMDLPPDEKLEKMIDKKKNPLINK